MERPTDTLAERALALANRVRDLAGNEQQALSEIVSGMTDADLLQGAAEIGLLSNLVDAIAARYAGEIAARSARDSVEPLAKRLGEKSAPALIAATSNVPVGRAAAWVGVGQRLAARRALTGEELPGTHPLVAEALDGGRLCLDGARVIVDALAHVSRFAGVEDLEAAERFLVEQAVLVPVGSLLHVARAVIDRFDQDGIEPREEALRQQRFLKVWQKDGMLQGRFAADPESGGLLLAALQARTAPRRGVRFVDEGDEVLDAAVEDDRTAEQRALDAFVGMARDSLKHDDGDISGTAVTVLVGMTVEQLTTGLGAAQIFGIEEPISAGTARRLAADAKIIPYVLGGDSVPLDFGKARRLFSEAQRLALAVQYGGCTWWTCTEPPGRCEAAHIDAWWAEDGPTDLTNGILLCPYHHRRFDQDGWKLKFEDGVPYFLPPPWIDPTGTPRRGRTQPALPS